MLRIKWSEKNGWGTPLICQLRNFDMHPAAKVRTVPNDSYNFWADLVHKWSYWGYDWHPWILIKIPCLPIITCVPLKKIVNIFWHCACIIHFLANSYFILQNSHAKTFNMRYIMSLYKPFEKYESWFCSEVSKLTSAKYTWNDAFSGMKKGDCNTY